VRAFGGLPEQPGEGVEDRVRLDVPRRRVDDGADLAVLRRLEALEQRRQVKRRLVVRRDPRDEVGELLGEDEQRRDVVARKLGDDLCALVRRQRASA
jgi:hypothetical protein